MDINHCIIQGRLTMDPQLHYTNSGRAVTRFPIACERPYADSNGQKIVDFIPIIVWREYAERVANNLQKGQECVIIGRLQSRIRDDLHINTYEVETQEVIFGQTTRGLSLDVNHITITGRLTTNPELHYVGEDSIAVTRFTIASERSYTDKEGNPKVDYLHAISWRSYGERLANDLVKGMSVTITGRIQSRKHKKQQATIHEIHADKVKYNYETTNNVEKSL
ncbi:single-stranded DNA-binding protein [Bacillus sp. FJAT-44742]|uniref:single-stranded DNA-binding protein n=1 Tax=Bacillus sp. FJAT-44742 TaxID=2014005 RepID=UPI000C240EA6|nr:single-stranded DNA-binding protein [Bacillus sp. FJAT-44742]